MNSTVKKVALILLAALGFASLSGCIVVPEEGYYHHHYYHDWR